MNEKPLDHTKKLAEQITNELFGNATRLLLVQESNDLGHAVISNATYHGGWAKKPMTDRIADILQAHFDTA